MIRYITRFTEESFTFLIGAIFIVEAFRNIYNIKRKYPVNFNPDWLNPPDYTCDCISPINKNHTNGTINLNNTKLNYLPYTNESESEYLNVNYSQLNYQTCLKMNGTAIGPGCGATIFKDNIYFLSMLLFIGTFIVAKYLKSFQNTRFFPEKVNKQHISLNVHTVFLCRIYI